MKRKNAIIPAIGFVLGAASLVWLENHLSTTQVAEIRVTIDGDAIEVPVVDTPDAATSREIERLLDTLPDETALQQASFYTSAPTPLRQLLLRAAIKRLMAESRYHHVTGLLEGMSLADRLASEVQFSYALARARQSQTQAAQTAYEQLIAAEPLHQAGAINLGLLYNQQEAYERAIPVLTRAAEISSGERRAKSLSALASSLRKTGDLLGAEARLEASIAYRPSHAATWVRLAEVMATLGRPFDRVARTWERACALDPDRYSHFLKAGRYFARHLDADRAVSHLSRARELAETSQSIRRELAWALYEAGNENDSRIHWDWLRTNSDSKPVRRLSDHMMQLIDETEADSVQLDPGSPENRYVLAQTTARFVAPANAVVHFEAIPEGDAWYYRAQLRLLDLYLEADDRENAAATMENLSPDDINDVVLSARRERLALRVAASPATGATMTVSPSKGDEA